jgi:hypothetical protein
MSNQAALQAAIDEQRKRDAFNASANDDPVAYRSRLLGPQDGEALAKSILRAEIESAAHLLERSEKLGAHYDYTYKGIKLDPYRIFKVYGITDPAQQHAAKKILRAGQSIKNLKRDIREVIATCERWLEMLEEEAA